jgi:signal transduction histidine kinase
MTIIRNQDFSIMNADHLQKLFRRHVPGALVRSGASVIMWVFALVAFLEGLISTPETNQADERKLRQIMYNLLSNAVKFTPDGGSVILSARYLSSTDGQWFTPEAKPVGLPLNGDDELMSGRGLINVSVQDTGIGIKREDLKRIFDPFEQVESSASRRCQGTGLGLTLTRRLVELHGGKIWAESDGEGKGSKFIFVIPA